MQSSGDIPHEKMGPGDQIARGFFGRRAGKPLTPRQQELMNELLPELRIDTREKTPEILKELFPNPVSAIWLEIGFGAGHHFVHRAEEKPDVGFIGVEPFRNGMAKALVLIEDTRLSNVRLYDRDAASLLDWLPDSAIDGIYLLYPDPWPKKRHFKRRFIGPRNLDRFQQVLKPGAEFRFASDMDSYVEWTLDHCARHPSFDLIAERDVLKPWDNWPGTRYEEKAMREGRVPRYLSFVKQS